MTSMRSRLFAVLKTVCSLFKSRRQLTLENLALRQQLAMLKPSVKRPQALPADRLFWVLFSKLCKRMAVNVARIAPRYHCTMASAGLSLLLALEESRP